MSNVVTYCRVSSDEQAQRDLSIPAQRKALKHWIQERNEHELAEEFVDEGESAYAPADKRPGFCRMIAYCRKHPVEMILVHKLDRFSRNREESILFKSLLRKHGVTVKSITENYDPETPQGFLYEGMIEVINQFYSMNLATETQKGMRENAERGYRNGGYTPYGYRKERTVEPSGREHSKLVLGPADEVATVREIFRLAVEECRGTKNIATILNKCGVVGPQKAMWSSSTLGYVLNNRVYVGDTVWNRRCDKNRRLKDVDAWVVHENTHEAIIDRALFARREELAAQRAFNMRGSPRRAASFLLSRMIRCDHCGAKLIGCRTKRHSKRLGPHDTFNYRCNTYISKGKYACPSRGINCKWLDGEVINIIQNDICSPRQLSALKDMMRKKVEDRRSRHRRDPRALERKIALLDQRIENYYRAIGDGMDTKTCQKHIANAEAEKATIEKEAEILRRDDYHRRAIELNLAELERFAAAFDGDFHALPIATQRQIIQHFIEEIRVVEHDVVRVKVKIPFNENGMRHLTHELRAPKEGRGGSASAATKVVARGRSRKGRAGGSGADREVQLGTGRDPTLLSHARNRSASQKPSRPEWARGQPTTVLRRLPTVKSRRRCNPRFVCPAPR